MDRLKRQGRSRNQASVIAAALPPERPRWWIELLSLALSVAAIITAGMAYLDQRDVNGLTQDRYEHRYAFRVAWWQEVTGNQDGTKTLRVNIENRSPVPISVLHLQASRPGTTSNARTARLPYAGWISYSAPSVPPCTIAEFKVKLAIGKGLAAQVLRFVDGNGVFWVRDWLGRLYSEQEYLDSANPAPQSSLMENGDAMKFTYTSPGDCTDE